MNNLALYRKYRPQDFSSVYGQETITRILKNQIETGRIGHAYLFSGIRGTGKTTIAKIFAKAVNCEHPVDGNPCGECSTCKALSQPSAMDIIEIDAASNRGVDEIRELRETISYPPNIGKYKVYIIDETHMLTKEAFNALLKTLEEPPEHAIFLLATTEPAKLPSTILSRCQQYNIRPIDNDVISERLKEVCGFENVSIEDDAIDEVTRRSGHSMRDALSLLDQCIDLRLPGELITEEDISNFLGISSKNQIIEIAEAQLRRDGSELLDLLNTIRKQGKEDGMLLEDLTDFYKQFLYFKIAGQESPYYNEFFTNNSDKISTSEIYSIIDKLIETHSKLRFNSLSNIITDTGLLSLCFTEEPTPIVEPHRTVKNSEKSLNITKTATSSEANSVPIVPPTEPSPVIDPEPVFEEELTEYIPVPPVELHEIEHGQSSKGSTAPQETTSSKESTFDIGVFKKNIINAAKKRGESLLSMLFENAEYRMNKHGLFIIIEDGHAFMFHTTGFQEKLQSIVNQVLGRPVNVYPKLKSKYYEHFGKKEPEQKQADVTAQPSSSKSPEITAQPSSSKSIEEQVKDVIGDPSIPYEVID